MIADYVDYVYEVNKAECVILDDQWYWIAEPYVKKSVPCVVPGLLQCAAEGETAFRKIALSQKLTYPWKVQKIAWNVRSVT